MSGNCTTHDCDELTAARLCHTCTGTLTRHLRDLVDLALGAELHTAATRQTRLTRAADTVGRPSDGYPLPVDLVAADLGAALTQTLTAWVQHVAATMPPNRATGPVCHPCAGAPQPRHTSCATILGTRNPNRHPSALAQWLSTNLPHIRTLPTAGDLADEIAAITRACTRSIDLPQTSILAGACPDCERPVYAHEGATLGHCRTPECQGTVRVDQGRAEHLDTLTAADAEYTAADAARILTALGHPITRNTITQWHTRSHITPASWAPPLTGRPDARRRPRFRLADLRAHMTRP